MLLSPADWVVMVGVVAVAWILGWRSREANTWRGYWLGSQKMGSTSTGATYVGANLTFTAIFLILSEEAYERGLVVMCIPAFWLVGTWLFLRVFPHLAEDMKAGLTLHGSIGRRFGSPGLSRLASIWTIAAFVGTIGLEFYGGILLLKWAGLPLFANLSIALLFAFGCAAFTVTGGFRGLGIADIWMDLVALLGTGILASGMFSQGADFPGAWRTGVSLQPPSATDVAFVVGMGVIFVPFQLCVLDGWQRCSGWVKQGVSPRAWLVPGAIVLAVAYSVPVLIGDAVRRSGVIVPEDAHPLRVFVESLGAPSGVLGIVCAGFFCAIFSTADELMNCCSFTLLFDVFGIKRDDPTRGKEEEAAIVLSGMFYTGLSALLAAGLALLCLVGQRRVSDVATGLFAAQVAFAVPLLMSVWRPESAKLHAIPAVASVLGALCGAVATVAMGWSTGDEEVVAAAPLVSFGAALVFYGVGVASVRLHGRAHG